MTDPRMLSRQRVAVGDELRNVHTGEVVPVLEVTEEGFVVPGRRGRWGPKPSQTWPWPTLDLDWKVESRAS